MTDKWFFDTATGEVSQGTEGGWESRMGPYDSREEAAHALDKARKRNEEADAYDRNELGED